MKKILLSTVVLFTFSLAIAVFQMSCQKTAMAQVQTTQSGKILFIKHGATDGTNELWTANYDGTSAVKLDITLPVGLGIDNYAKMSPDQKTIFFSTYPVGQPSGSNSYIYACNTDGSNPHQVVTGPVNGVSVTDVY